MGNVVTQVRSAPELDLEQRLRDLPPSAAVRGVFFWLLREEVGKRGLGANRELADMLRAKEVFRLYPAADLLKAYATAASLIEHDPNEGLRKLFSSMAPSYAKTWYGQLFSKFVGQDPGRALGYVERARERVANYGSWRLEIVEPRHVVLHMFDEYCWIESAQRGGCEALLEMCRVDGEVNVELDGPYRGALDIRWTPRNRY
jgi:uncharacterized protein (TIGR02265 family)